MPTTLVEPQWTGWPQYDYVISANTQITNAQITYAVSTQITYPYTATACVTNNVATLPPTLPLCQIVFTPMAMLETPQAQRARLRRKKQAEKTAEQLLRELLTVGDYRTWKRDGIVFVSSKKHPNLGYQIKAGKMIQLFEKKNGIWAQRRDRLCVHPAIEHPAGDEVGALYALAMWDEEKLWKTANWHDRQQLPAAA